MAAYGPKQARAGPDQAVEKAVAIDSVVFVVVRNVVGHNIGSWVVFGFTWQVASHLSLLIRLDFIPDILRIRARAAVIFRNSCFAVAAFRPWSLQKRRARASPTARRLVGNWIQFAIQIAIHQFYSFFAVSSISPY